MRDNDIKHLIEGEIATDDTTREKYSRDYSIFEVKPQAVIFPKTVRDIEKLVTFVSECKERDPSLSLTGRAAGTDMSGGSLTESLILDFTRHFNHIREIANDYAWVEPGVYFRDLEKELHARHLLYPPYPASKDLCAVGGMVSNNSGGEKTLAYGKTAEYVREIKIVLADGKEHALKPLSAKELQKKIKEKTFEGTLYRKLYALIKKNEKMIRSARPEVTKNSSGYALWNAWNGTTFDITRIIVGAQGTLGLMTAAKLKLVPQKKYTRLTVVFLNDVRIFGAVTTAALRAAPETLEFYDDRTLDVALRSLPDLVKTMHTGLFKLAWSFLPEFFMVLRGGLPKFVLLIELTDDDAETLNRRVAQLHDDLAGFHVQIRSIITDKEALKYWTVRRASFNLLHEHNRERATVPFIDDVVVRPDFLPEFLPKINAIIDRYKDKLIYTIAGHAGDGNLHIIPLMNMSDPAVRALIPKIAEEVYTLVRSYHGSMTGEHNDGLIRTPYLSLMYGEKMCRLFEEVKTIFDPKNIFNPGKKVGGSLAYSMQHIKTRS